jgi:hypothetical protein
MKTRAILCSVVTSPSNIYPALRISFFVSWKVIEIMHFFRCLVSIFGRRISTSHGNRIHERDAYVVINYVHKISLKYFSENECRLCNRENGARCRHCPVHANFRRVSGHVTPNPPHINHRINSRHKIYVGNERNVWRC